MVKALGCLFLIVVYSIILLVLSPALIGARVGFGR